MISAPLRVEIAPVALFFCFLSRHIVVNEGLARDALTLFERCLDAADNLMDKKRARDPTLINHEMPPFQPRGNIQILQFQITISRQLSYVHRG